MLNRPCQTTLRASVAIEGIGLHGGHAVTATLYPAPSGFGVRFRRTDIAGRDGYVPARWDLVSDTMLCTRLRNAAGVEVATVEHLMAAFHALGVDNVLVEVDDAELPVLDGSAGPWVAAIDRVGIRTLGTELRMLRILEPVRVEDGDRSVALLPWPAGSGRSGLRVEMDIAFDDPAIGRQACTFDVDSRSFRFGLAAARTFCLARDVTRMRSAGLALGGSLDNAVVVEDGSVLNPGGLRFEDEFVRHKALDVVGDLALAGAPVIGRYVGVKAGHALNNRLLRALFARPEAWCLEAAETPAERFAVAGA